MINILQRISPFNRQTKVPGLTVTPNILYKVLTHKTINTIALVGVDGCRWLKYLQSGKITAKEVHCFEPNEEAYRLLCKAFPEFTIHQGALSEVEQVDSYIHYLDRKGNAVKRLNGSTDMVNILVKSYPLAAIIDLETPLDVLVVDRGFSLDRIIEGAELSILHYHPVILYQQSAYCPPEQLAYTFDRLTVHGYQFYWADAPQAGPLSRDRMINQKDKVLLAKVD